MRLKRTFVLLLVLFVTDLNGRKLIPRPFDGCLIHNIHIQSDHPELLSELSSRYRKKSKECIEVGVRFDGIQHERVGVREKGTQSNAFAWTQKKPLKIVFNEFIENNHHLGTVRINLANAFEDPSFLRDALSLYCLKRLDVVAPSASYGAVHLNEEYLGLYVLIEQVDQYFLKKQFGEASGNLYKGVGGCFESTEHVGQKHFELKSNKSENDRRRLKSFIKLVSDADDQVFADSIEAYLNTEGFLKCMAFDFIGANTDSYVWGRCHNFYIYEKENGQFEWIAWDYNQSFGYDLKTQRSLDLPPNEVTREMPLLNRLLAIPKYQVQFKDAAAETMDLLRSKSTRQFIKQQHDLIDPWVKRDTNAFYPYETFESSLNGKSLSSGLNADIPAIFKHIKDQKKRYKKVL